LVGASLAKAFGAPIAFLAGAERFVADVARHGPSRWHSSPASAAAVAAAAHALDVNERRGDELRARLGALAARVGSGLAALGLGEPGPTSLPLPLPIQSTRALPRATEEALFAAVEARGLRCLLQHARCRSGAGAVLTFLVTAAHDEAAVD